MITELNKNMRILLIGGNPDKVTHIKTLLSGIRDIDFHLDVTSTISQGIDCCKKSYFDVVMFNLKLSDSSGLSTFRKIYAVSENTPVIVITSRKNENIGIDTIKEGAADFLVYEDLDSIVLKHSLQSALSRKEFLLKFLPTKITPESKSETEPEKKIPEKPGLIFHDSSVGKDNPLKQFSLLQELIDNIPNPIFYKNKDLIYIGCNKAFEDFIGLPAEKIIGSSVLEISPLELAVVYHDADAKLLKQKGKQVYENKVQSSDGSVHNVIFYKSVYHDVNGNPDGIVGLIVDVTDKKRALETWKAESEISKGIAELTEHLLQPGRSLDALSQLVLKYALNFTGAKHGFAGTIHPITEDLLIHSFSEMIEECCNLDSSNLKFEKMEDGYPALLGQALNTREAFYTNEPDKHPASRGVPEKHLKIGNFLSVPTISEGKLVGQIALANTENGFTDDDLHHMERLSHIFAIAVQKHLFIQDLMMAKEKAEQSDKLKSAFLANMSHEIRTPLNAIVGFSEMLAETEMTQEESRQFRKIISHNSDLLLKLINDIIEMAMIEAGELKIRTQETSIVDIATDAYNYFAWNDTLLAQKKEIEFLYEPDQSLVNYLIDTDPIRLNQVLKNLIHNAFRFTKRGFIKFGYRLQDSSFVCFYVEDTGIGISKEQQKYIFDKFRQVDEMSVRPYSGTGLGLSITKKLVEKLNGNISMESEPGKGTIFRIIFPVLSNTIILKPNHSTRMIATPVERIDLKGMTFLIVEDNVSSFEYLNILLKGHNCHIIQANDGKEAIQKFAEEPGINIILMDLQLPELDGYSAIETIRKFDTQVPVIVQTAFSTNIERTKAIEAGANEFLIKPISKRSLFQAINKVMQ